jgi:hypothetical protein
MKALVYGVAPAPFEVPGDLEHADGELGPDPDPPCDRCRIRNCRTRIG